MTAHDLARVFVNYYKAEHVGTWKMGYCNLVSLRAYAVETYNLLDNPETTCYIVTKDCFVAEFLEEVSLLLTIGD